MNKCDFRNLTESEMEAAAVYFNANRKECIACRYTAKIGRTIQCGMVYYDCLVVVPVCLEKGERK